MKKTKNKPEFATLHTQFEENIPEIPYSEYPRPQLVRDSYLCLNGKWSLSVIGKDSGVKCTTEVLVPFPPESRISGTTGYALENGDTAVYEREVSLPCGFFDAATQGLILHFGAVDQIASVYVNGAHVCDHVGGYLPFSLDVGDLARGNTLSLRVEVTDDLDHDIPYGKQRKKRGGMWYTPISGIWQTVWLEAVPKNYFKGLRITPTLDSVTVEVSGGKSHKTLTLDGRSYEFDGDSVTVTPDHPHPWTPDDPYLYNFTLTDGTDTVSSYFALRTVTVERREGRSFICLNGNPTLLHGLLDQGYFSDGIYLPATPEGFVNDILTVKRMGFNMLRKHIKIEPELFYYYCDLYGMIVLQDIVNSGKYSFIVDTALPTVLLRRGITHTASKRRRKIFEESARDTVGALYNHPCICYYTLFNEGWGQYDADRLYTEMKTLDPTRIWDATSGWFKEQKSDVQSEHIYFKPVKLRPTPELPLVLSEFGGYSCIIDGHIFNPSNNYGYKTLRTSEQLTEALRTLYIEQIVPEIKNKGLCATVLTQVSDVEDETNGLLTYDRRIVKVNEDTLRSISSALFAAFDSTVNSQN